MERNINIQISSCNISQNSNLLNEHNCSYDPFKVVKKMKKKVKKKVVAKNNFSDSDNFQNNEQSCC